MVNVDQLQGIEASGVRVVRTPLLGRHYLLVRPLMLAVVERNLSDRDQALVVCGVLRSLAESTA